MKVDRTCSTCKYNFGGTCAYDGSFYGYHEVILEPNIDRDCWDINLKYFGDLLDTLPEDEQMKFSDSWYLTNDDLLYRIENGKWQPRQRRRRIN